VFKSMVKRAWLSISRKLSKTVVLAIVMFVMANLVLAAIAIKNAVNESTRFAKESLGSTVYLTVDMEKVREEAQQGIQENNAGGPVRIRLERPTIYVDMVKAISESSFVRDYTYGINATAKEGNFTAIEDDSENGQSFGGGGFVRVFGASGNMQIMGINSYAFISEVKDNSLELVMGSYFDEDTDGKAIISNELAQENGLKVGDKVELLNEEFDTENYDPRSGGEPEVISSTTVEVEIIGIYDVNTDNFNANTIYMNVDTAAKFLKEANYKDGNYGVDNISYFLNSPEDVDKFISEVGGKYPSLADDKLKLDIDSSSYDQMAGPIEQVGSFADTVLWIVILASILIITLIINNNIKDRKYEIGVLMSLGGSKLNVIGQILTELIIIGTAGFVLSIGTSYFLANSMGKSMLDKQVQLAEEQATNNYGRPGTLPGGNSTGNRRSGGGFNINLGNIGGSNSNVDTIDKIDVNVSGTDYLMLFLIGYLVSSVAMIIPAVNIVKYEPKTILTGRQ